MKLSEGDKIAFYTIGKIKETGDKITDKYNCVMSLVGNGGINDLVIYSTINEVGFYQFFSKFNLIGEWYCIPFEKEEGVITQKSIDKILSDPEAGNKIYEQAKMLTAAVAEYLKFGSLTVEVDKDGNKHISTDKEGGKEFKTVAEFCDYVIEKYKKEHSINSSQPGSEE